MFCVLNLGSVTFKNVNTVDNVLYDVVAWLHFYVAVCRCFEAFRVLIFFIQAMRGFQ